MTLVLLPIAGLALGATLSLMAGSAVATLAVTAWLLQRVFRARKDKARN